MKKLVRLGLCLAFFFALCFFGKPGLALKCFEQDHIEGSLSIKDCFLYSQVCFTKRIIGLLGDNEKSFRGCENLTQLGLEPDKNQTPSCATQMSKNKSRTEVCICAKDLCNSYHDLKFSPNQLQLNNGSQCQFPVSFNTIISGIINVCIYLIINI